MSHEPELYYLCQPETRPAPPDDGSVEFAPVAALLADEAACAMLWELIDTQFSTRWKFLSIWRTAAYVALHRDAAGSVDGLCIVSAPVNWQIDYVVVRPDARGQGIAAALVRAAVGHAARLGVPYVMLTSRASLRPLYESCGFQVVASKVPAAAPAGV